MSCMKQACILIKSHPQLHLHPAGAEVDKGVAGCPQPDPWELQSTRTGRNAIQWAWRVRSSHASKDTELLAIFGSRIRMLASGRLLQEITSLKEAWIEVAYASGWPNSPPLCPLHLASAVAADNCQAHRRGWGPRGGGARKAEKAASFWLPLLMESSILLRRKSMSSDKGAEGEKMETPADTNRTSTQSPSLHWRTQTSGGTP